LLDTTGFCSSAGSGAGWMGEAVEGMTTLWL
jgi:hypothetical protein